MIPLEMTQANWLWALLPVVLILGWYHARSLSDFPRPQRVVSLVFRLLILGLIVLSLSGLSWLSKTDDQCVILLIDESQSVDEEGQAKVQAFLEQVQENLGNNKAFVLPFAATPRWPIQLSKLTEHSDFSEADPEQVKTYRDGTDIAATIQAAAGYMPAGYVPRIVLLTDGNET